MGLGVFFAALGFAPWVPSTHAIEPPVLRLSMESEPVTLDWNHYRSTSDRFILSLLMRGLMKYDEKAAPVCDLCESFSVSPDGKVYRFEIKSNVRWSDGVKLEAKHFADSLRQLIPPTNGVNGSDFFHQILSVRADRPTHLEIRLARPIAIFPDLLTTTPTFPLRSELMKKGAEFHVQTAVLGPYQLAAWEHGKRIVIEGNPGYEGARPVYRVEFIVSPHSGAVAKFASGKIDILSNPTTEDLVKFQNQQRVQVSPYWATRNLLLNLRRKVMAARSFRHALLLALDRDSLPAFLRNGERRVTGLIPPGLVGNRELPLVTVDLAQARLERDQTVSSGRKIELKILVRDTQNERRVAEWLTSQLAKMDVSLISIVVPNSRFDQELDRGNFDVALSLWSFELANPLDLLRAFVTGSPHHQSGTGWSNAQYDQWNRTMLVEQQPQKQAASLDQATQIIEMQDVAVIPLGYPTLPFLLGPRVISFATTPFGDPDLIKIQLKQ